MNKHFVPAVIAATVATLFAGLAVAPSTFAAEGITTWADLKACLETEDVCGLGSNIDDWGEDVVINAGRSVTLDLGSYSLTSASPNAYLQVQLGGDLTLKGQDTSSIVNQQTGSTGTIRVYGNGDPENPTNVTVESGVTLEGVIPINVHVNDAGNYADLDIAGKLLNNSKNSSSDYALNIHSSIKEPGVKVNISGSVESTVGVGIFQSGVADTTISGSVSGLSGIIAKSGTLTVDGGSVTGTGGYSEGASRENGFKTTGAAIQIDSWADAAGNIELSIKNGAKLSSTHGNVIHEYGEANHLKSIAMSGAVTLETTGKERVVLAAAQPNITITLDGEPFDSAKLTSVPGFTTVEGAELASSHSSNPDTADASVVPYVAIAVIAVAGLGGTVIFAKKFRR